MAAVARLSAPLPRLLRAVTSLAAARPGQECWLPTFGLFAKDAGKARFPGEQEPESLDTVELAGFKDTQHDEGLRQRPLAEQAVARPLELHERLDGMLGPVVVPGHAVVIEEGEQFRADFLEPLLVSQREFGREGASVNAREESLCLALVLVQVPPLQPVLVNRVDDPPEDDAELRGNRLELLVVRVLLEVVVHVAQQVEQAFLLGAVDAVI